jgi:hypothetical protein
MEGIPPRQKKEKYNFRYIHKHNLNWQLKALINFIIFIPKFTKILRVEHRLMVFENWVLRGIFAPKKDEMTRG